MRCINNDPPNGFGFAVGRGLTEFTLLSFTYREMRTPAGCRCRGGIITAAAAIAANAGCASAAELAITRRISAVAVYCSNASRVSVSNRAFSIAMTACTAKFCNSAICWSVKGRISCDNHSKQCVTFPQRYGQ